MGVDLKDEADLGIVQSPRGLGFLALQKIELPRADPIQKSDFHPGPILVFPDPIDPCRDSILRLFWQGRARGDQTKRIVETFLDGGTGFTQPRKATAYRKKGEAKKSPSNPMAPRA